MQGAETHCWAEAHRCAELLRFDAEAVAFEHSVAHCQPEAKPMEGALMRTVTNRPSLAGWRVWDGNLGLPLDRPFGGYRSLEPCSDRAGGGLVEHQRRRAAPRAADEDAGRDSSDFEQPDTQDVEEAQHQAGTLAAHQPPSETAAPEELRLVDSAGQMNESTWNDPETRLSASCQHRCQSQVPGPTSGFPRSS